VIEIMFFSLGDGVCASAAPPIAKATKRQNCIRIPNLFIPTPLLQVVAGEPRIHVPSAPSRDLHSAFRKSGRLSEIGICIIRNVMTATAALHKQIERYRIMTGEERLAIALDLHEVSCDIAREGIRHDHPEADPAEVERLLRRRLELTRAG
jgi:hypothetical protein